MGCALLDMIGITTLFIITTIYAIIIIISEEAGPGRDSILKSILISE